MASSPSSTAANRDGSASAAEVEAVMSATRAFAQDALLQFQSGKFDQCLTALSECLKRKPNDPKKRSEELARTSAEQVESGSNTGDKVALGSKGSGAMGHSFSAVYMDEFDTYVATLNIAVIWFHLHEYAKALSVVEPLFQNRGPIDEKTALNICLLLLDVGLACHDAMKSADVLIYLDKAFGVSCMNQGDGGSTASQQPANPVARPPSLSTNSSATDGPTLDSDPNALEPEETSEYDNADFDMDVAQPTVLLSSNDISRNPVDISASSVYLKLKMQLYKDNSLLIVYNCGMQYLACGKPLLAARCFQKAGLVFYNRPLLWLRFAECCLMALEKGLMKTNLASSEVRVYVIGNGKWRQLVMEDGVSKNGNLGSFERGDLFLGSDRQPKLSVSLARQCLLNALSLLNRSESSYCLGQVGINGDGKEQKAGTTQELVQNSLSYYADVRNKENLLIKQALLANLAYVELELENPMKALSIARSLLELPECSRIYIFLGGNDVELPFSEEDCEQLQGVRADDYEESNGGSMAARNSSPEDRLGIAFLKPEEAQANLYVNFAALYAMQGELDQARQFVAQALSITPNSPEATLTAVYVDLKVGQSQEALAKLKHCSRITFVPSGLTLNKAS